MFLGFLVFWVSFGKLRVSNKSLSSHLKTVAHLSGVFLMVLFPLMFSSCICFLISIFSCFPLLFLIRPARIFFVLCFPPPFPSKEPELMTSFFKLYWHFASIRILSPDPWALLIAQEFLKGRCRASLVFTYLPGTWTQHMTHTQFFTFCFCACDFAHLIELQGGFHSWQCGGYCMDLQGFTERKMLALLGSSQRVAPASTSTSR